MSEAVAGSDSKEEEQEAAMAAQLAAETAAATALMQMQQAEQHPGVPTASKPALVRRGAAGAKVRSAPTPALAVNKHGTGRQSRRFLAVHSGGIKRVLPSTDAPVTTDAEKLLFAQLLIQHTAKGRSGKQRVDYHAIRVGFNLAFMSQIMPPSTDPASGSQGAQSMLYSKSVAGLRAYHQLFDRAARVREATAFNQAIVAHTAAQVSGQRAITSFFGTPARGPAALPSALPLSQVTASGGGQAGGGSRGQEEAAGGSRGRPAFSSPDELRQLQLGGGKKRGQPTSPEAGAAPGVFAATGSPSNSPAAKKACPGEPGSAATPPASPGILGMIMQRVGLGFGQQPRQLPDSFQAASSPKSYLCGKCALLLSEVRLKSEHPAGGCPARGDYKEAEAAAKRVVGWGPGKKFDIKAYISFLKKSKPSMHQQLSFSPQAKELVQR
jgi:hypothetical protein